MPDMSSYKVLLIDDDDNVRSILSFFLQDLGFSVVESSNGHTALPMIREHHPHLVFCDLVMPGISGLVVLKQIRLEFPNQKVVMMSGLQEEGTAAQAMELGAINFAAKPLSLDQIESILKSVFPSMNEPDSGKTGI